MVVPDRPLSAADRLLAVIGAAVTSVGLLFGWVVLGMPGVLLILLVPVPCAWVQMRAGFLAGTVAVVLAVAASVAVDNSIGQLVYLSQCALVALLLPWLMRRGVSWDRAIAGTVLVAMAAAVAALLVAAQQQGTSPTQLVEVYAAADMAKARELLEAGGLPAERQQEIAELLTEFTRFLGRAYVGVATTVLAIMALLTVWALSRLPGDEKPLPGPAFIDWKTPDKLVWVLITAGFLLVLAPGVVGDIGLNLLVVLVLIYYLQGLAVATHLFVRRRMPFLLRMVGYYMMLFVGPMQMVVAGVGLFDLWIDFRSKYTKE